MPLLQMPSLSHVVFVKKCASSDNYFFHPAFRISLKFDWLIFQTDSKKRVPRVDAICRVFVAHFFRENAPAEGVPRALPLPTEKSYGHGSKNMTKCEIILDETTTRSEEYNRTTSMYVFEAKR